MDKKMDNLSILALNIINGTKGVYGYTIAKTLQQRGVFTSHQLVYRVLGKLAKTNLLSVTVVEVEGKPDRRTYSITAKGKRDLALATPSSRGKDISAYLLALSYPENVIYVSIALEQEQLLHDRLTKVVDSENTNLFAESIFNESSQRLRILKGLLKSDENRNTSHK